MYIYLYIFSCIFANLRLLLFLWWQFVRQYQHQILGAPTPTAVPSSLSTPSPTSPPLFGHHIVHCQRQGHRLTCDCANNACFCFDASYKNTQTYTHTYILYIDNNIARIYLATFQCLLSFFFFCFCILYLFILLLLFHSVFNFCFFFLNFFFILRCSDTV